MSADVAAAPACDAVEYLDLVLHEINSGPRKELPSAKGIAASIRPP
jgi:hypothetical protein